MVLASRPPPPIHPDDVNAITPTLLSPKSSKCNISRSNGRIAFKFYTEVKYLGATSKKLSMTRLAPQTAFADDTCIPQIFEMQYLHEY